MLMINTRRFHRNPFSFRAKQKKYIWHAKNRRRRNGQGKNIKPPVQRRLWKHKTSINGRFLPRDVYA